LRSHNLKPHRSNTFKLSLDPRFLEKFADVIGLYLNPPDRAIVLCRDEKSQIQALNRTQPGLPMKKGRCGTMTHDYKRNGTTTLFAALDLLQGKVIGDFHKRHRQQGFLSFLRRIDRKFPGETILHLVMDNYGTHGHANVKTWLDKHSRFVIHYVPTSCSWLNLIERWFAELTNKRIRRDSFLSVDDLVAAIEDFLAVWNENPKPFVWTATVDSIAAKLVRCRQTLEQIKPGCTAAKAENVCPANSWTLHIGVETHARIDRPVHGCGIDDMPGSSGLRLCHCRTRYQADQADCSKSSHRVLG
jgi:transposase